MLENDRNCHKQKKAAETELQKQNRLKQDRNLLKNMRKHARKDLIQIDSK